MKRDEFMAQIARLLADMPDNERMEAIRYIMIIWMRQVRKMKKRLFGSWEIPRRSQRI